MRLRGTLAGAVLAALTLASCGDSATPGAPTSPAVEVVPTVLSISPVSGPTSGGTVVTIRGANFTGWATVTVGGVAATNVTVTDTTTIQATTGARSAGPADVTVTVDGRSSTLTAGFTYVTLPPPTVSAISPSSGPTSGGTTVTLTGTSFASGATVSIGGAAASGVSVLSATSLRAVTGARATAGAADVVVTVGAQSGTLVKGYTYVASTLGPSTAATPLAAPRSAPIGSVIRQPGKSRP